MVQSFPLKCFGDVANWHDSRAVIDCTQPDFTPELEWRIWEVLELRREGLGRRHGNSIGACWPWVLIKTKEWIETQDVNMWRSSLEERERG